MIICPKNLHIVETWTEAFYTFRPYDSFKDKWSISFFDSFLTFCLLTFCLLTIWFFYFDTFFDHMPFDHSTLLDYFKWTGIKFIPGIKMIFLTWILSASISFSILANTETPKGLRPKIAMTSLERFLMLNRDSSLSNFGSILRWIWITSNYLFLLVSFSSKQFHINILNKVWRSFPESFK